MSWIFAKISREVAQLASAVATETSATVRRRFNGGRLVWVHNMYVVYVIKSTSGNKIYVGHTDNLDKRLSQHNSGYSIATKQYSDWRVVYTEEYNTRSIAMKRERYLKSGDGRRVLKLKGVV